MDVQLKSEMTLYAQHLKQMVDAHPALLFRLQYLRELNVNAYLSAGIIRNMVWARLHGQSYQLGHTEIDVIFYDVTDFDQEQGRLTDLLSQKFPENTWDVVNQAFVHKWYKTEDGQSIAPYCSLFDALSAWPETATAIAVRLLENGNLEIIAPFGLTDLFELKLRWNNRLVSHDVFMQRVKSKCFLERWNKLAMV